MQKFQDKTIKSDAEPFSESFKRSTLATSLKVQGFEGIYQAAGNMALQRHATTRSSLTRPVIQRFPANRTTTKSSSSKTPVTPAPATKESAAEAATPTPRLIVEDSVKELAPGQMRKSEFLSQLRSSVCSTAEEALSGTIWSAMGCPWIDHWFAYYSARDSASIERAIRKYAPTTAGATSASDYIPITCNRVRQAIENWSVTGEISGVPEGMSADVPAAPAGDEGPPAEPGSIQYKRRGDQAASSRRPGDIRARLGTGRPLDSGVRSRMSGVFGQDFSNVRIHSDDNSAQISDDLNARAFTIGNNIAFGKGEYQPGTLIGDALIAHELAHTIQQSGGNSSSVKSKEVAEEPETYEHDADSSAVHAIVSAWGDIKTGVANIKNNALPGLKSGLRLQRCKKKKSLKQLLKDPIKNKKKIIKLLTPEEIRKLEHPDYADWDDKLKVSKEGRQILKKMIEILNKDEGNLAKISRGRAQSLKATLDSVEDDLKTTKEPLNTINTAINTDSRKNEYQKVNPPLKFPVKLRFLTTQQEVEPGGVYYQPDKILSEYVYGKCFCGDEKKYIQLYKGTESCTNEKIRSILWHEFQHYKICIKLESTTQRNLTQEERVFQEEHSQGAESVNEEIYVYSIQIKDDFKKLTDKDVKSILNPFATYFGSPKAKPFIKQDAIIRISHSLKNDHESLDRFIRLIGELDYQDQRIFRNLKEELVKTKRSRGK